LQKTIKDIQKISFLFFIITGILHIGSNLFIANNLYKSVSTLIFRIIDIPFILTGAIYGLSSIRLLLTKQGITHKKIDIILAILVIILLLGLIIINISIPNIAR